MYNYAAQFFIPPDSGCSFSELEPTLRMYFENQEESETSIRITKSEFLIELRVQEWRLNITLNREPLDEDERQYFGLQCDDENVRQKIITSCERWELVTDSDEYDQYYNYFQLTCDEIKTQCPEAIQYDPTLGEFLL
jgi:hypothetical protein